jgi:hypothetical protein
MWRVNVKGSFLRIVPVEKRAGIIFKYAISQKYLKSSFKHKIIPS